MIWPRHLPDRRHSLHSNMILWTKYLSSAKAKNSKLKKTWETNKKKSKKVWQTDPTRASITHLGEKSTEMTRNPRQMKRNANEDDLKDLAFMTHKNLQYPCRKPQIRVKTLLEWIPEAVVIWAPWVALSSEEVDLINASTNECSKAPISKNWTRPGFQEIPIASQYPLQIRSEQTNTGTTIPKGKSDKQQPSPFCTLRCQHNHQLGSLLGLCGRICWLKRSSSLSSHANSTEVHSCTAALIRVGALTSLDPTSRFHRESFGKCPKQRHGKCASFPVAYDLHFIPFMVGLLSLSAGDPTVNS